MYKILILCLLLLLPSLCSGAESSCVDATGEAPIISNDLPSAKGEAITRAEWTAVEQVAGVQIKAQSADITQRFFKPLAINLYNLDLKSE